MTDPASLLQELAVLDVRLSVQDGRLSAEGTPGAITPELRERIRASKPALLALLGGDPLQAVLPSPLLPLIRVAVGECLPRFVEVAPGQVVPDLNGYVLAAGALYAAGFNPEEQLKALWLVRRAWAS